MAKIVAVFSVLALCMACGGAPRPTVKGSLSDFKTGKLSWLPVTEDDELTVAVILEPLDDDLMGPCAVPEGVTLTVNGTSTTMAPVASHEAVLGLPCPTHTFFSTLSNRTMGDERQVDTIALTDGTALMRMDVADMGARANVHMVSPKNQNVHEGQTVILDWKHAEDAIDPESVQILFAGPVSINDVIAATDVRVDGHRITFTVPSGVLLPRQDERVAVRMQISADVKASVKRCEGIASCEAPITTRHDRGSFIVRR